MSFFEEEVSPDLAIPILNKVPEPLATIVSSQPSTSKGQQNGERNSEPQSRHRRRQRQNQRLQVGQPQQPHEPEEYIRFVAFEHFSISTKTVKQLCGEKADGIDVHVIFLEDLPSLPKLGLSVLTLDDLWEDKLLTMGERTKPEHLDFIKILPYEHFGRDVPPILWANASPKKFHTLSISMDIGEDKALKYRLSYQSETASRWFRVSYMPSVVEDFSLVICMPKKDILRRITGLDDAVHYTSSIQICTTLGWLNWRIENGDLIRSDDGPPNSRTTVSMARVQGTEYEEGECTLCYEKGSDLIFHPCGHCIVHEKCLRINKPKIFKDPERKCFSCNCHWTRLICIKKAAFTDFELKYCRFCNEKDKCRRFDSYLFPCGCLIGCFEGFQKRIRLSSLKLECINCGQPFENIYPIYRANSEN